jgi:hypothetical protein
MQTCNSQRSTPHTHYSADSLTNVTPAALESSPLRKTGTGARLGRTQVHTATPASRPSTTNRMGAGSTPRSMPNFVKRHGHRRQAHHQGTVARCAHVHLTYAVWSPTGVCASVGRRWVSLSRTDVGAGAKTRCTPWLSPGQWTSQCSEPRMGQSTSPARGTTRRHCRTLSLPSIGRHQDCSKRSRKGTISGPSHIIEYTDTSESAQAHAARGQQQQASATLHARSPTS